MGIDTDDEVAASHWDALAARWAWWCMTRCLLAPGVKSNVLARFQPRRRCIVEPDAFMDADMPYFNMAVHALCEMPAHALEASAFVGVHWYAVPIKALAHEQQCARGTVYNRARRFAQRAHTLAASIRKAHLAMTSEKCSISIEQNSSCGD